ncbi:conserved hypothetical protein [Culex quinquefasciatus]|uniref:Uncharacterized protein n=1 Tax=Culex quinquefasciatus TaxID=7176 RepID=B0VZ77_CULQU|nr:conserved hypothetical protein [Culex quinquefasciatus]|eukprot:XP_001841769.1 conserved hypothetical protein [Culex quinquefasciatus]
MSDCLYDAYDDSEDYYDTQYEDLQELDLTGYEDEHLEWSDLYQSCVLPSFLQISAYILPFIGANILLCCSLKLQSRYAPAKGFIAHILSSGVGIYLLYSTMHSGHLYVILLLISIYLLLKASFIWQTCRLRFDYIISIYAVMYLILCEIIEEDRGAWHHARGVLMIAVMKAISLAFDTRADARLKDAFSILSFLGTGAHGGIVSSAVWCGSGKNRRIAFDKQEAANKILAPHACGVTKEQGKEVLYSSAELWRIFNEFSTQLKSSKPTQIN